MVVEDQPGALGEVERVRQPEREVRAARRATSANPPSMRERRDPVARLEPVPSARCARRPPTSLPGTNGSSGLIWYAPARLQHLGEGDAGGADVDHDAVARRLGDVNELQRHSGPLSSTIWIARMRHTLRVRRGMFSMSATAVNERLAALTAAGTSIWLDQLSRGSDRDRRTGADGAGGIAARRDLQPRDLREVDSRLRRLRRRAQGASPTRARAPREIYRSMALHDVQAACDVLRPVYDATNGLDGYVSWEVAPRLAHDTEGTLEQGRMYWDLVDRPNLMIKIPATEAGMPAIEQALFDGLNINVTLLFSVAAYEQVMEAYIRAMERRLEAGQAAGPPFGRVVLRLARGHRGRQAPRGRGQHRAAGHGRPGQRPRRLQGVPARLRAASASPRCARRAARSSARCGRRPASRTRPTRATLYVWGLVAPDTVNTMPMPVLEAAGTDGERHRRRPRAEDPERRPEGAGRRRHRPRRRHRSSCCARASTRSWSPMQKLLDGIEAKRAEIAGVAGRSKPSGSSRSCAARSCSSASSSRVGPSATIRPARQQHRALAQRARRAAGRG